MASTEEELEYLVKRITSLYEKNPSGVGRSILMNNTNGFDAAKMTDAISTLESRGQVIVTTQLIERSRRTERVTLYIPTSTRELVYDTTDEYDTCPCCRQAVPNGLQVVRTITQPNPQPDEQPTLEDFF